MDKKKVGMLLLGLLLMVQLALASPVEEAGSKLVDQLSFTHINEFITQVNSELSDDLPPLNYDTIKKLAKSGISWQDFHGLFFKLFLKEVRTNMQLVGKLLFLAVLCSLLYNLQNSFESSAVSMLAYSICYVFLSVIALTAFYNALTVARNAVDTMVGFMEALLPLMITMLAGVGAITSAALFSPLMLFSISSISVVVRDVVLPMLYLTAVLECVNYLNTNYRLSNLSSFFKQCGMLVLGALLVLFVGIVSIQGAAGGISDGLTLRAAKYATSTFVPVLGGMFAETVELVMGASLVIKNAIGLFGVIVILSICALPIIKIVSLIIIMKVAGSLIQPMGDERMAKCLDGMGNTLLLVFCSVLTTALMFFIAITMIVGVGSMSMMLR